MDGGGQGDLVEVRRSARRAQAEQYALVLTAMGIQSLIMPEGKFTALYVALEDAARANEELAAYDSENRQRPPGRVWSRPPLPRVEVAMLYWTVLLFFFAAGRWGKPSDIGGATVFLLAPASAYMHGTVITIDGGWLAR